MLRIGSLSLGVRAAFVSALVALTGCSLPPAVVLVQAEVVGLVDAPHAKDGTGHEADLAQRQFADAGEQLRAADVIVLPGWRGWPCRRLATSLFGDVEASAP